LRINDQGITDDRYRIIPRTLIFITRNDTILLIKGSENKRLWKNKYNGIGGHIERDENVLEAAKRELYEETGLIPEKLWLCGIVTINTGFNTGIGLFVFRGECPYGEPQKSHEGELMWVKDTQYADLPLVEDLYQLLPRILAMRKESLAFFAHIKYDDHDSMVITFDN
jgi:8-oxo-dGTP diphosphatase